MTDQSDATKRMSPEQYRQLVEDTAVHPEGKAMFISPDADKADLCEIESFELKQVLLDERDTDGLPVETVDVGKVYALLGALGEVGEMANKQKKRLRGDDDPPDPDDEVGDVRWYVEDWARISGRAPGELEAENGSKLSGRQDRGTIKGSGDER